MVWVHLTPCASEEETFVSSCGGSSVVQRPPRHPASPSLGNHPVDPGAKNARRGGYREDRQGSREVHRGEGGVTAHPSTRSGSDDTKLRARNTSDSRHPHKPHEVATQSVRNKTQPLNNLVQAQYHHETWHLNI